MIRTAFPVKSSMTTSPDEVVKRDLIDGLVTGLEVICAFDDQNTELTASEMSERLGISRAAARRFLLTLVHTGYALSDGKRYRLTPKVLNLATAYTDSAKLPKTIQPFLQRLTRDLQVSSNCAVLEGFDAVYVAAVNVQRLMSTSFEAGTRLPAQATAAGRVLLAALEDEQLTEWIAHAPFTAFTPKSPMDKSLLLQELTHVRKQGFDMSDGLFEFGLRGIAVPIKNRRGEVQGALSVSMGSSICPAEEALQRCIPPMRVVTNAVLALL